MLKHNYEEMIIIDLQEIQNMHGILSWIEKIRVDKKYDPDRCYVVTCCKYNKPPWLMDHDQTYFIKVNVLFSEEQTSFSNYFLSEKELYGTFCHEQVHLEREDYAVFYDLENEK